jgi:hypothetical protein
MSDMRTRILPDNFRRGPIQGANIIGEVTEAMHRFLLDGWTFDTPPPRLEEDLSFVPKDREEVLYVYMYKANQNTSLQNTKRWAPAKISLFGERDEDTQVLYERPPLYLELYYLVAIHSRFRSEAERLMGWVLMRLYDATHLVYRPRRYILPEGGHVDSTGQPWSVEADGDDVIMEKVALSLVDDLTLGDAINFFTINEAPFRPYLTYRAQCSMEGPLISGPATTVRHHRAKPMDRPSAPGQRPGGRLGRAELRPSTPTPIGPPGHAHRPIEDNTSED